jgi:hypothetical protein
MRSFIRVYSFEIAGNTVTLPPRDDAIFVTFVIVIFFVTVYTQSYTHSIFFVPYEQHRIRNLSLFNFLNRNKKTRYESVHFLNQGCWPATDFIDQRTDDDDSVGRAYNGGKTLIIRKIDDADGGAPSYSAILTMH